MPIAAIEKTYSQVKMGPDEPVVYQDFPRMIYHYIKKPIVVNTEEELTAYLDQGWSKTPVEMNEIAALDAKIAEMEEQLKHMKTNRKEMIARKKAEKEAEERSA
jgi:hypothetical protein